MDFIKIYCESYFEQQKTGKDFKASSTNKLFAYAMRGLGLLELWVLAGTSVAGDRCPTLLFVLLSKWDFFVYLKKDIAMENETIISPELQRFMDLHKIPNLITLLQIEDEILLKMDGFGWRMMREVLEFRERY